jgi:hypothetical protein
VQLIATFKHFPIYNLKTKIKGCVRQEFNKALWLKKFANQYTQTFP